MVSLLTHICVTGPQWFNCTTIGIMEWISNYIYVKQLYVITHHSCYCFCIAISAHIRMNTSAFLALYSDLCFISPISSILSHCPSDTYTWRNSFWLWTLWGQHSTAFFFGDIFKYILMKENQYAFIERSLQLLPSEHSKIGQHWYRWCLHVQLVLTYQRTKRWLSPFVFQQTFSSW